MKKTICLFLVAALAFSCTQAFAREDLFEEMGEFQFMVPIYLALSEEDSLKEDGTETKVYFSVESESPILLAMAYTFDMEGIEETFPTENEWKLFVEVYTSCYFDGEILTDIETSSSQDGKLLRAEATGKLDGLYVEICIARGTKSGLVLMYANEKKMKDKERRAFFNDVMLK